MYKLQKLSFVFSLILLLGFSKVLLGEESKPTDPYLETTGKEIKSIIVPDDTNAVAWFAADELQRCIQLSTRVKLPIIPASSTNIPKPAFLLGKNKITDELGIDLTKLALEGCYLKTTGDYVVIAGDDHPLFTADMLRRGYYKGPVEREAGTRIGTLFGVYSFLKKVVGADWYFPGPLGEVIPIHTNLAIPNLDLTVKPSFEQRMIWIGNDHTGITELSLPEVPDARFQVEHVWRFRSRQGKSWACQGSHTMHFWGTLFGKDHPEYFALVDGKRQNDWGWNGKNIYGTGRDYCWANPAAIARQADEMRLFFQGTNLNHQPFIWIYSDKDCYPIGANDGTMHYCECELCRRWYTGSGEFKSTVVSDLYFYHVAEVAKVAKKEFPGKYIVPMAYGGRLQPPEKVILPDNVKVVLAGNIPAFRASPQSREFRDCLIREWRKRCEIPLLWEYTDFCRRSMPGLPLVIPHLVAEELKTCAGVVGGFFFCQGESETGPYTQPELYVATELMWDITQDTDQLLDRFYKGLYGPAAEPVKACYTYLEQVWTNALAGMQGDNKDLQQKVLKTAWTEIYTPERLAVALDYLKQARRLVVKYSPEWNRLNRCEDQLLRSLGLSIRDPLVTRVSLKKSRAKKPIAVTQTDAPPVIDGQLTDAFWQRAPDGWMVKVEDGTPPRCKTSVWVGRDADRFLVAVRCAESNMPQLAATVNTNRPTEALFALNDDVEIFLDPADSGLSYFQFAVDPVGQTYASGPRDSEITNVSFRTAVSQTNDAWCVEAAIPFDQLGGVPKPGTSWGINVTRTWRPKGEAKTPEYDAWFPSGSYHEPAKYGRIQF